jgi:hypothetical protein
MPRIWRQAARARWIERGVQWLGSIEHGGKSIIENYRLSAADVQRYLSEQANHPASLVSALPALHMSATGKARWVEKTPDHLPHVGLIRRLMPNAKILRIVRDPRDVALSLCNVPWGPTTILRALRLWHDYDAASEPFFAEDQNSLTIRYEDLVGSPVATLQSVCGFLGEEFEQKMLDTADATTHVNSSDTPWKRKVAERIDATRVEVWRRELPPEQNRLAEALLGNRLQAFRYVCQHDFPRFAAVYPKEAVFAQESCTNTVAQAGFRLWPATADERACLQLFLGEPDDSGWFGSGKWRRGVSVLTIGALACLAVIKQREVQWITRAGQKRRGSICARVATAILRKCERQSPPIACVSQKTG